MSLSVFSPSSCCLLSFYLVFCHCFKAMSLVGILPQQDLFLEGVQMKLAAYVMCMRSSNLEVRIVGSSCYPQ